MKVAITGMVLAVFVSGVPYSQAADQSLEFEVASIKQAPPRMVDAPQGMVGCFGGPGSRDPLRYTCVNASVSLMVLYAYRLKAYQIPPPASEDTTRFNVAAKVSPGATAEQVRAMLQNLLADRFKLAFHHEKTEVRGYALVVAKRGLKMQESAPDPPRAPAEVGAPPAAPQRVKDKDGFAYFPMRNGFAVSGYSGLTRWVGGNVPTDSPDAPCLTGMLNILTGQAVVDSTGLKGKYDFTLTFSSEGASGTAAASSPSDPGGIVPAADVGPSVFGALEGQLGLKLEPKKIMIDAFVIDHAERTPTEN
jgi:uncharacterized protein (TIGR03435 family)